MATDYGYAYHRTRESAESCLCELQDNGAVRFEVSDDNIVTAITPKGRRIIVNVEKTSPFRAWFLNKFRSTDYYHRAVGFDNSAIHTEAINHVIEQLIGSLIDKTPGNSAA